MVSLFERLNFLPIHKNLEVRVHFTSQIRDLVHNGSIYTFKYNGPHFGSDNAKSVANLGRRSNFDEGNLGSRMELDHGALQVVVRPDFFTDASVSRDL